MREMKDKHEKWVSSQNRLNSIKMLRSSPEFKKKRISANGDAANGLLKNLQSFQLEILHSLYYLHYHQ